MMPAESSDQSSHKYLSSMMLSIRLLQVSSIHLDASSPGLGNPVFVNNALFLSCWFDPWNLVGTV